MAVTIIDPFDSQMPFPIDLRQRKQNSSQRDAIPTNSRYEGLLCYVQDEQKWYLKGGTDNSNWILLGSSDAPQGDLQNVYFNPIVPVDQGNDGDIWFRPVAAKIELYFKVAGTWNKLGEWNTEGSGGGWPVTGNVEVSSGGVINIVSGGNINNDGYFNNAGIIKNDSGGSAEGQIDGRGGKMYAEIPTTNQEVANKGYVDGLSYIKSLPGFAPGKVLAVNSSGTDLEWIDIESGSMVSNTFYIKNTTTITIQVKDANNPDASFVSISPDQTVTITAYRPTNGNYRFLDVNGQHGWNFSDPDDMEGWDGAEDPNDIVELSNSSQWDEYGAIYVIIDGNY